MSDAPTNYQSDIASIRDQIRSLTDNVSALTASSHAQGLSLEEIKTALIGDVNGKQGLLHQCRFRGELAMSFQTKVAERMDAVEKDVVEFKESVAVELKTINESITDQKTKWLRVTAFAAGVSAVVTALAASGWGWLKAAMIGLFKSP